MKICLIAPVPPFRGGIAKYCQSLARELDARHELLLLSYRRQYPALLYGNKPQRDPSSDNSQPFGRCHAPSFDLDTLSISSWRAAMARIDAFAPDLIILPWWVTYWTPLYAWLLRGFRRRGIKCLLLCINVYDHEDSICKKLLTRFILRQADLLITHSAQESVELREINRTAVIRKELLPIFGYEAAPPVPPRSGDASLHLLFFGFVRAYKGLDLLLRAMTLVKGIDLQLKIVGEFWEGKEEYLKIIDEAGLGDKVRIIDRYVADEEMASHFAWADVVVLPYRAAKTSGVIATAYGYGRPVLATDVGGFGEVVRDGYTGKLVPADDCQALANGITWFHANRRINFGENIEALVAQEMSWGRLVDVIEEMVIT